MKQAKASKTAEYNALFRALDGSGSSGRAPLDPMARTFLSGSLRLVEALARIRPARRAITRYIDSRWPGVRTSVVARTRLIDDLVSELTEQVSQVVLLGAGFDSRAHRLPALSGTPIFEVDHPATQARKQALLSRSPVELSAVTYVPLDFEHDHLRHALAKAGLEPTQPTLILWEGVTNYLTDAAVDETLTWCGSATPGSHLVFTYIDRNVLTRPSDYNGANRLQASSRRADEPLTFGIDPSEAAAYLAEHDLTLQSDLGATDYRRRFYGSTADKITGHEFYRVAHATITARVSEDSGVAMTD